MTLNFYTLGVIYLVYSFLGWVAETVVATIRGGRFANRGAAAGPFCFIYGTTGVLLAVSFGDLRTEPVYLFFACMMAATVMEWITAKLLERLHRRKWWDYSGKKFNLNGYVCLQYSLLWGALGTASVLWGNNVLLRLCAHIPVWLLRPAVWVSLTVAVLDQIGSAVLVQQYAARHPMLEQLNQRLGERSDTLRRRIALYIEKRIQYAYPAAARQEQTALRKGEKNFLSVSDLLWLFVIGAFLGYFSGKMLLQKTVHVFRRGWIGFGVCCLALVLAFSAAEFDLFGYSRYLPQREEIQAAGLTQEQYFGSYTSADGAYIDDVLALHTTLVENRAAQEHRRSAYQTGTDQTQSFYITYRMADGQLVERYYSVVYDEADAAQADSLISQFSALYNSTTCVRIRTGFDTPRTEKNVLSCYVYSNARDETGELTGLDAWAVYDACRQDIDAGQLGAGDISGVGTDSGSGNYTPLNLIFTVTSDVPGETDSLYVESIPLDASATVKALQGFGFDPYWPVTKS